MPTPGFQPLPHDWQSSTLTTRPPQTPDRNYSSELHKSLDKFEQLGHQCASSTSPLLLFSYPSLSEITSLCLSVSVSLKHAQLLAEKLTRNQKSNYYCLYANAKYANAKFTKVKYVTVLTHHSLCILLR